MNPKLLILFLIIILLSFWRFVIGPIFEDIDYLKKEIKTNNEILRSQEREVKRLEALKRQYESLDEKNRQRLTDALPEKPRIEELLVEMETLARKSGTVLADLNIKEEKKRAAPRSKKGEASSEEKEGSRLNCVAIDLTLKGSYDGLKKFLLLSEKDLRIMDIKKITFSSPREERGIAEKVFIYDFQLSMKTYFYD